jgi:hypothetical protein
MLGPGLASNFHAHVLQGWVPIKCSLEAIGRGRPGALSGRVAVFNSFNRTSHLSGGIASAEQQKAGEHFSLSGFFQNTSP